MARRAVNQHKTKPAKRTPRRRTRGSRNNPSKVLSNFQAIDVVYFQRWRNLFGSERAVEHLEDLLRSKPSWHVSASGKVTRVDLGFWVRTTLSEETRDDGVDCLAVYYRPAAHDPKKYSRYNGRFFLRPIDINECEERLGRGNNSDFSPIEKFEQEEGLRPRTPPRLYSAAAPLPPASETTPAQQLEDKTGDPVEADDGLSAGDSPQESKVDGWQVRRVKQALQALFPPDGHPPLEMALKAILKRINEEFFKPRLWKFASLDSLARAMGRRT
jgi:hypothetical protein